MTNSSRGIYMHLIPIVEMGAKPFNRPLDFIGINALALRLAQVVFYRRI